MGKWRLIKNSVRFAFRAKRRWITFVIIFAFLSAFITFFAGVFNMYSTDELLEQKGFYIKANGYGSVTDAQAQSIFTEISGLSQVESVALFRYFDLGDYIRVFGVDPDFQWAFREAKPSLITDGHYVQSFGDAVVSQNATIKADVGTFPGNISVSLQKGDILHFENPTTTFELTVVGEIKDIIVAPDKLRIYITDTDFESLHTDFGASSPIYCYSMAVLVKGDLYAPFNTDIYDNMNTLDDPSEPLFILTENIVFGDWLDPDYAIPDTVKKDRASRFLYFIFGMVGGILLTILYNFLIVWFRRREIAVLRAMGYEKGEIRINLLGESLTISIVGYIIGILAILIYFWTQQMTFTNQLLNLWTLLISFGIVVGLTLPGLFLSSFSFVRVSPVILFKGR